MQQLERQDQLGAATPSRTRLSIGVIALVILWNMWQLRATSLQVAYLNDSAMHQQMVRFANQALDNFHLPMTQWYPYLNLGSPHFLHYQGLAATLAGALGLIFGPNGVFRWSLYLLIVLWPIVIYRSAKVFRLPYGAQIAATLISPFLISVPLVGYEQKAYIWIGFGVWAQLCASWFLPMAWAWTWRAIEDRRYALRAVVLIAITASLHFETGYMAFAAIVVFPFIIPSLWRQRLKNAALLLGGALLATAWVTVPLLVNRQWAAINTAIASTGLVRGYGARQNISWLVHGQLFDNHRLPVITVCLALGVLASILRWRRDPLGRVFVILFVGFFLVSWGPTTWGSFIALVPGHADIYFRRFQMSVSLAGIYLAGLGLAWIGGLFSPRLATVARERAAGTSLFRPAMWVSTSMSLLLAIVAVGFAFPVMWNYDKLNAKDINGQRAWEARLSADIDPIINYLQTAHDGRVYAGLPTNWGSTFTVGYVPVFEYLTARDIDQVGFTLRTASLMEQPEAEFNENNPSDYALFGIKYLLLPTGQSPRVAAKPLITLGPYKLWMIPQNGYFDIVVPSGSMDENKGTIAAQAPAILNTSYFAHHVDFAVNWGVTTTNITSPTMSLKAAPGSVISEKVNLLHGDAQGTFRLSRPANVVLAASYDPGWQATVDGHPAPTQMLAPAVVSVAVLAGRHVVEFHYQGFRWYLELGLVGLAGLWFTRRVARRAPRPLGEGGDAVVAGSDPATFGATGVGDNGPTDVGPPTHRGDESPVPDSETHLAADLDLVEEDPPVGLEADENEERHDQPAAPRPLPPPLGPGSRPRTLPQPSREEGSPDGGFPPGPQPHGGL